ncbi:MAG: hypothetical protein CM15mL8_440 [Caudoviricetes sp.]|nr:MAG: hypothetical protein CM15mL8_440 [Caudoviricetes sp.]
MKKTKILNQLHEIVAQDYEGGKHDLIEFMFRLLNDKQLDNLQKILNKYFLDNEKFS